MVSGPHMHVSQHSASKPPVLLCTLLAYITEAIRLHYSIAFLVSASVLILDLPWSWWFTFLWSMWPVSNLNENVPILPIQNWSHAHIHMFLHHAHIIGSSNSKKLICNMTGIKTDKNGYTSSSCVDGILLWRVANRLSAVAFLYFCFAALPVQCAFVLVWEVLL